LVDIAGKHLVLRSINLDGETRCVDLFRRPDGTFGFEEFRRDSEDQQGWFPIGFFGDLIFDSEDDALVEARTKIP
jgi:hypothetical protein